MSKILIVDDDAKNAQSLQAYFSEEAFEVTLAPQGQQAVLFTGQQNPDLIILNLDLSDMNGLDLCRLLRQLSSAVILVSTNQQDILSKVLALEFGADICLTWPYSFRELMAHARALLRQVDRMKIQGDLPTATSLTPVTGREPQDNSAASPIIYNYDELQLALAERSVQMRGRLVSLKPKEFVLLAFMVAHPGEVLSREVLLEEVWGFSYYGGTRTVDVHIWWLREKLELDPHKPCYLHTVFGVGYKFLPPSLNKAGYARTQHEETLLAS